jgi:NAD-dependent deacetylase
MEQPDLEASIRAAADALRAAKHAVSLVGAGLSAESGIPTYRGSGGLWTKFSEPTIDGWDLFQTDPKTWWEQAIESRATSEFSAAIEAAQPNPGHIAMAELERMGRLAHVITQNIDDLHRRAGSTALTEIHGNRYKARCMNCGLRFRLEMISLETLPPLCPECGGTLKNDTVMFGEPIPHEALTECYRQAALTDLFLVIGTSAVVYPAADFPVQARRRGMPLIEINPEPTALTPIATLVVRATAGQCLPQIVDLLRQPAP